MKKFFALLALLSVVLACNMMSSKKGSNSDSSSSSGSSTTSDGEPVEKANPSAAQQAAVANGQTVNWDQQGITWTLPANWKKMDARNESFSAGGNGAFLTVAVSIMPQMADLQETSIKAMHEAAKMQKKIGKYDEVRWLEIDGLRGVGFRESTQESPDDIRRLQWQAYRTYGGSTQLINLILSTDSGDFSKHEDTLYGILYSTKVVH